MSERWQRRVEGILADVLKDARKIERGELKMQVISWYLKLVELKDCLPTEKLEVDALEVDRLAIKLGADLEYLYSYIDAGHELKQTTARHLRTNNAPLGQQGLTQSSGDTFVCYDGKDRRLWYPWKTNVERSLVASQLAEDIKYEKLVSKVVTRSLPGEIVLSYAGTENAFTLAWTALLKEYGSQEEWVRKRLHAVRTLRERVTVREATNVWELKRLVREVTMQISALKSLKVEEAKYGELVLSELQGCLPWGLRMRVHKDCQPEGGNPVLWVENILRELEEEVRRIEACRQCDNSVQRTVAGTGEAGTFHQDNGRMPNTGYYGKPRSRQDIRGRPGGTGDHTYVPQNQQGQERYAEGGQWPLNR